MLIQLTALIAIIGAIYVASNKALAANFLWSISNPALVIYNVFNAQTEQATMFLVFSIIAMSGVYHLTYNKGRKWYSIDEWNLFSTKSEE